jgi:hypothetical protein
MNKGHPPIDYMTKMKIRAKYFAELDGILKHQMAQLRAKHRQEITELELAAHKQRHDLKVWLRAREQAAASVRRPVKRKASSVEDASNEEPPIKKKKSHCTF